MLSGLVQTAGALVSAHGIQKVEIMMCLRLQIIVQNVAREWRKADDQNKGGRDMTTDLCFKCSNKDSILCSICGIAKDGAREHFNQKPITNADRIRSMTDEELAEFIGDDLMYNICPSDCFEDPDRPCKVCALAWLKQEVKE